MFYFKNATCACFQTFLWDAVQSATDVGSLPLVFNSAQQQESLALVYESYTDDIVSPSLAPGIITECLITEVLLVELSDDGEDDISNRTTLINGTEIAVEFSCIWTSRYTTVDYLPERFLDFVTNNLSTLVDDMQDAGLPVLEAFPPTRRQFESAPSQPDANATTTMPSKYPDLEQGTEPTATTAPDVSTGDLSAGAIAALSIGMLGCLLLCFYLGYRRKKQSISNNGGGGDDDLARRQTESKI